MTEWTVPGVVGRVIDGDSLVLSRLDLGWRVGLFDVHVRLAGVDAPDRDRAAKAAATRFVEQRLAPGDQVTVVSHELLGETEKYGRILASITLPDGRDLASELLAAGHAHPYDGGAR